MLLSGVYQPEESQSQEQLLRSTLPLKLANLSQRYGKYYVLINWVGGLDGKKFGLWPGRTDLAQSMWASHLVKISGNFSLAVNGKRFVGSSHWKIPGKSGKSKKVDPFSQLECRKWNFMFHVHVSLGLYQFQLLLTQEPSWCPIG